MTKNHFDILGLKPGVNEDELKKAYRKLARQWHPDKNNAKGAEEKFKEISTSYEYLLSEDRRTILESELNRKSSKPSAGSNNSYNFWSHNDFKFGASSGPSQPNSSKTSSAKSSFFQNPFSKPSSATHKPKSSKENAKPHKKKTHWTDSFVNKDKNKPNQKKSSSAKYDEPFVEDLFDDEDDFQYDFENDSEFHSKPKTQPKSTFSFAFQSFVDQLDNEFVSNLYPGTGPTSNSSSFGTVAFPSLNSGVPGPRARKKETAQETGYSGGLNEEYLFHRPKKSDSNHSQSSTDKYECNFCNKKFNAQKLITHELRCGKWKEDDDEEEEEVIESDEEFDSYPGYQKPSHAHWQDSHTDLLNQIKLAKKMAKMRAFYDQEQFTCQYCGMCLNQTLADKHQVLCARRFSGSRNQNEARAKQQRATEYARNVPRPNGGRKTHRGSYEAREGSNTDRGTSESPSGVPRDFEVNGAGIGAKKPGNGCSNCTRKYGNNAKFTCSCGTQKSGI